MTTISRPDARRVTRPRVLRDSSNVFVRELRPVLRDPFSLIFSLVQPLVFLGLFGPLLIATSGQPAAAVLQSFVPGVLVMIVLFGTGTTGSNLLYEMQTGSHERTLVAPIARSSLLIGRAVKELAPILVQAALIVVITLPFGFRPNLLGMVIGLVILGVFGIGLGALSYSLALAAKDNDWMFWGVHQTLLFPLLILSGMLLPLDDAPGWMQVVATINPLSHVVNAERALFAGDLGSSSVLGGAVAAIVVLALGLTVGIRAMKKAA